MVVAYTGIYWNIGNIANMKPAGGRQRPLPMASIMITSLVDVSGKRKMRMVLDPDYDDSMFRNNEWLSSIAAQLTQVQTSS